MALYLPRSPYPLAETVRVVLRGMGLLRSPGKVLAAELILSTQTPTQWLGFVGDIMPLMWRDARFASDVTDFLAPCHVVVGNFEGILTSSAWLPFLQKHTPQIFDVLLRVAPKDRWVLGVANNHASDYGTHDFAQTLLAIERAGMRYVGSSDAPSIALAPDVSLSAWTHWQNRRSDVVCTKAPQRPNASIALAFVHWGHEFVRTQSALQKQQVPHDFDAVIGHHPHFAQPVEHTNCQLIAWSLGNFITEVKLRVMGEGMLLKLGVAQGKLVCVKWQPIVLDRGDKRYCTVRVANAPRA